MSETVADDVKAFIERWKNSGGRERANYQIFLTELCELLGVERPDPALADASENAYTFDRAITHTEADGSSSPRYIDLYKAGAFVLETKQGVEQADAKKGVATGHGKRGTAGYDKTMTKAHAQAEGYIHDLPSEEGRPPFLMVCDIGYVFELYAEFTCSGGRYQRFPDPKNHRIFLDDLARPEVRELLRTIWTDPLSLDPSKRIAKVTRDIADRLAKLAKSLEEEGHDSGLVAEFLQRCLFTMFAEDIGLLPEDGFLEVLRKVDENPQAFPTLVTGLWSEMATGTEYSTLLFKKIAHFNGGLFENAKALPLNRDQVDLLINAAEADWAEVDPAIFGTLLERALDARERHKLGAHYTPRSYVERLIEPTVIQPLREQWESVKAAAVLLLEQEKNNKAREEVETFHHELCRLRILDPACGSGNFLYVTLEHMKQLEAEVLDFYERIGGNRTLEMDSFKVRPDQFWGMEINPSAVSIAQLVLWIGYFQWHHKTTGKADTNDRPLLPKQNTILHQDAVLAYDEKIPRVDEEGKVVEIWDGVTTKSHPVTGKEVPDESATRVLYDYTNPRRADWPESDYVVGNPPFVGASKMIEYLGDGYTKAVRKAWYGKVPESADFVMYWWWYCAELARAQKIQRFGLITTNSILQTFNRRVLESHLNDEKKPMHLAFAIPDHPWVDSADGADVRIAMTVGSERRKKGALKRVVKEEPDPSGESFVEFEVALGWIHANLSLGANVSLAGSLLSNSEISCPGVKLHGSGFLVDLDEANAMGLGTIPGVERVIRSYRNGRDLAAISRNKLVIDLLGMQPSEVQSRFPEIYQHVFTNVKPERDQNRREAYRRNWWLFGEPRVAFRPALGGLRRYISTPETAKHRFFVFLDGSILPDNMLVNIAFEDAYFLGALSSHIHIAWALATGGTLEDRPRYNKTRCFETFPFPDPDEATQQRIRDLGERLDAHRKRQQELHSDLTLTGIYNVLEKLRSGEALTDKEKRIHDDGLVSVLKQIHDDLDEAVFHAYGWDDLWQNQPVAEDANLPTANDPDGSVATSATVFARDAWENELLERLVALNHERAQEEKNGKIRWLRPEFQNPDGDPEASQEELKIPAARKKAAKTKVAKQKWPDALPDQVSAIQTLLPETGLDATALSGRFGRKSSKREEQISQVLEVLQSLGRA